MIATQKIDGVKLKIIMQKEEVVVSKSDSLSLVTFKNQRRSLSNA